MDNDNTLPAGLLLAYYGDDFTGSTDSMESFTIAGVPTVLFLAPPTADALSRFPQARAVGLAGTARSRSPQWMDAHLPAAFDALAALGAPLLHYKVCSTFDSSPAIGSIGRAIDIGVGAMRTRADIGVHDAPARADVRPPRPRGRWSPLIVAAPRLQRFQLFGHLFAAVGGVGHRLDRHPTMSRHPVTPMNEADLTRHLAAQTARRIELIDAPTLKAGRGAERLRAIEGDDVPVVAIDVLDDQTLEAAGALVWAQRGAGPPAAGPPQGGGAPLGGSERSERGGLFTASSSGLQDALAAHWRARGWLPQQPSPPVGRPVEQIAVVSGSCSPATAGQIAWARANGFAAERLDLARLFGGDGEPEVERLVTAATSALRAGRSPLVYSAEGPDDPAVTGFEALVAHARVPRADAARRVGEALAEVMRRLLDRVPLPRVVVAGGDSSGEVAQRLGIDALTVEAVLAPGAPLCRAWRGAAAPALDIVLKGGQVGAATFFGSVREGRLLPP
jgi:uncharacterized protein YgbK (DUF1537 family)